MAEYATEGHVNWWCFDDGGDEGSAKMSCLRRAIVRKFGVAACSVIFCVAPSMSSKVVVRRV